MRKTSKAAREKTVRALLEKHGCPVPFHVVRARFLGTIATPEPFASPLRVVEGLWGGELPAFESMDEANELIGALVQGLWNDLTRHQKRGRPFRLAPVPSAPTAENLARYGRVRLEELEGFLEGLFNGERSVDLPERARDAVGQLAELRAMMGGICELMSREPDVGDRARLETLFKRLPQLTRIMETEINEAVLACARARRRMLDGLVAEKPTLP